MTPQLVDLNADGHQDMLMATFEGTAFLVAGSKEGWEAPVHIKDENDTKQTPDFRWTRGDCRDPRDPDFDAGMKAVYYVRVLEIPTPRWSTAWSARPGHKACRRCA